MRRGVSCPVAGMQRAHVTDASEVQPEGSSSAACRPEPARTGRLWIVLAANLVLVVALVIVGIGAHSLGVFAEGVDYLADAAGVGVSLLAIRVSTRRARAPDLAALINAGWLTTLCIAVIAGATLRLTGGGHDVHGLPVLIVSGVAALVMLAGALLLGGDVEDETDLNRRAVLLDTAADAAAAAGVALAGAIIYAAGGLFWLDPVVALLIALVVGWHAVRLLVQARLALRS
jgi:cobalt-zinc-cadmium efflux system protein